MSIEEDTKITEEVVKEETNEIIQKPKVKKTRSEAQVKAFEIARQKLAEKRRINKENKDKELAVRVKEKELAKRKKDKINEDFEKLVINDEEEEEDNPVVITKPKQTRKKKAKQKIVLEEESSDSEQEIVIRRVRKDRGKKHPAPSSPRQVVKEPDSPPVEEPIYTYEPPSYTPKQMLRAFGL